MKKQILFMMFLSLAFVFAGLNSAYGQDLDPHSGPGDGDPADYINYLTPTGDIGCADVTPLTCVTEVGALNPQAGLSYTYEVEVTEAGADIHWFVTDELNIINALNDINDISIDPGDGTGSYVLESGTEYDDADNTSETINIRWKSFTPPTDGAVLLVTYVVDAAGCTDNIEVYRIEPVFNFSLDIAGLAEDGTITDTPTDCVSPIEDAVYDATNSQLDVDYGENWLFFSVTAANFTHSWMPSFQVEYDGTVDEDITVEWAYPADAEADADWKTTTLNGSTYESGDAVLHSGTDTGTGEVGADDGTGECIVVRVRIDHGPNENPETTDLTATLKVDGVMYDPIDGDYGDTDLADLSNPETTGEPCEAIPFDDEQDYILTPRPLIETATPLDGTDNTPQPFEEKNP